MKILFIRTNCVDPDVRVQKEITSLLKKGHDISILGWDKKCNSAKDDYVKIAGENIKIHKIQIRCGLGGGFKKNIIPLMKFQVKEFFYLIKTIENFDVIHACDFNTALICSVVCRMFNKPYVYDIFDYYTDSFAVPNALKPTIEKIDHCVIKNSARTILCSENRIKQVGLGALDKYIIIHNAPIKPNRIDGNINLLSNTEKYKLVYVGALAKKRKLDLLAEAISELDNCELHIAGFGELEDYFKEKSNNSNIFFYGKIDYEQTLRLEKMCDGMVALYPLDIKNHIFAAPNKFYEALMLGKPIMMIKGSGMSDVIEANGFGVLVTDDCENLKSGIIEMIAKSATFNKSSEMMQMFDEKYSWEIMEERLIDLYNQLESNVDATTKESYKR